MIYCICNMEEIKKFLQQILNKIDGLYYINIADKDGVTFIKLTNNSGPNLGSRLHLLSNFNMVAEQANKLGIGRTMSVTSQYNDYQVIQIYSLPLVITFVADVGANTGYILTLENQLMPLLNELKEIVLDRHDMK